jgi:hypothetical protein
MNWTERHAAVQEFALRRFASQARNMASAAGQDKEGRLFKTGDAARFLDDAKVAEECLTMLTKPAPSEM